MFDDNGAADKKSTLINRNVVVNNHRTSVRLEAEMWTDLREICRREGKSIHEVCSLIGERKTKQRSLTSAIRVFLIAYYRAAATEDGHSRAGHGQGYQLIGRAISAADVPRALAMRPVKPLSADGTGNTPAGTESVFSRMAR
jgi:predicted DNA-binding ribbon-helix-helix protein